MRTIRTLSVDRTVGSLALGITCLSIAAGCLIAAADPVIAERGQNHRTWQRVAEEALPNGTVAYRTNAYVELSDGIYFWKDGQWRDTKAEFQIFPGGVVAQEGPFQLIISPDISTEAAVDLLAAGGQRFRSSPRWLALHNRGACGISPSRTGFVIMNASTSIFLNLIGMNW